MARNLIYSIFASLIFLFLAVITIKDYNIMWDARVHFLRGQAFANFFLTGQRDYKSFPISSEYARYYRDYISKNYTDPKILDGLSANKSIRRSAYKEDDYNFNVLMTRRAVGHPPLSDIGSAFANILFYEKLGVIRDDHAYGLFSVFIASLLIGVFFYWIVSRYGFFPAIISTVALATTPIFWAESHSNTKDIPSLVFFTFAIWAFWKSIIVQSKKWILLSAIFAGCALGTKFNIVFLPFIVVPWFVLYLLKASVSQKKTFLKWWWTFLIYPIIMFVILIASWPQLWHDLIPGLLNVTAYYKDIATNIDYTPTFRTFFGFNTYALVWILYTTFPAAIVLSAIGIFGWAFRLKKTKDFLPLLFLLWFAVTLIRVALPNTAIYGGVRQIMEYIPALSFFSGYGVYFLSSFIAPKFKVIFYSIILLSFIPLIFTLVRLHPAENAYFNSLIGGLNGAKKAHITGWGNTDGGIYSKAVVWLNNNAEKNSHVATAFSDTADLYIPAFRPDLLADNNFSGYLQKGEYIIALTHDSELGDIYGLRFPETYLEPVYVYSVDNVPLLKIWKNDKEHLKKEFAKLRLKRINLIPQIKDNELLWELNSQKQIVTAEIEFTVDNSCKDLESAIFQVSNDGIYWNNLQEGYPGQPYDFLGEQPKNNNLTSPIGKSASYLALTIDPTNSCLFNVKSSRIMVWE